jgi:hypothetical protein
MCIFGVDPQLSAALGSGNPVDSEDEGNQNLIDEFGNDLNDAWNSNLSLSINDNHMGLKF